MIEDSVVIEVTAPYITWFIFIGCTIGFFALINIPRGLREKIQSLKEQRGMYEYLKYNIMDVNTPIIYSVIYILLGIFLYFVAWEIGVLTRLLLISFDVLEIISISDNVKPIWGIGIILLTARGLCFVLIAIYFTELIKSLFEEGDKDK